MAALGPAARECLGADPLRVGRRQELYWLNEGVPGRVYII